MCMRKNGKLANEDTKVHNPRRYNTVVYCHIMLYVYSMHMECVSLPGSIRKFSKDSALRA